MGKKLFVGNLNFKTNDDDLRTLFSQAGTCESATVMMDRATLRQLSEPAFRTAAGPAANEQTRQRHGVVEATSPNGAPADRTHPSQGDTHV